MERDRYTPTLTIEVPRDFTEYCETHDTTPAEVIEAFMADLAPTTSSGTSVDRGRIAQWFHGITWGQPRWPHDDGDL